MDRQQNEKNRPQEAPGKKPYRGIIFDLDGTLLDTAEGVLSSVRYAVEVMGYEPLSDEVMRTFIGPPVKHSFIRVYGLDDAEAAKATEVFRNRYKGHDLMKAVPYAGIMELLKKLKEEGFLVGVATLKREDYAILLLEHYHISDYCDCICGSDFDSKMLKIDVLQNCLAKLELSPKETVLIGDTSSDGTGAAQAGTDFIAVTYGFGPSTEEEWSPFHPVFTAGKPEAIGAFLNLT